MTKEQVIEFFGTSKKAADAMGVGKSAISMWPDGELSRAREALAIAAALKTKGYVPAEWLGNRVILANGTASVSTLSP